MIFITDQNCWFAHVEPPYFLSYDTGVSHHIYETKQCNYPPGCAVQAFILNCSFGFHNDINDCLSPVSIGIPKYFS